MDIKKIKFKKIIYPAIFTVFIITVIILFVYSVKFLANAIDKAFVLDMGAAESRLTKLDLDNFYLAAKKLGIAIESQQPPANVILQESIPVSAPVATTTPPAVLDKSAIKIEILNSTKIGGLASDLKAVMEAEGFKVEKTGNTSPPRETTVIQAKESKSGYLPLIKESVSGKYQPDEDKLLDENGAYDIIIIIGNK
jgi:hypothetical protein